MPPPLPEVGIGKPGYKFKFPAESLQGQDERREHERLRKAERRQAVRASEPPPLPPAALVGTSPAPAGEPGPGAGPAAGAVDFVPWSPDDVVAFTDELIELCETRRVDEFVKLARAGGLPEKLCREIEAEAHYTKQTKAGLKRTVAAVAAKWLNKSGMSSRNKEEVALLFFMVTVKLQGMRLSRDIKAAIAEADAKKAEELAKAVVDGLTQKQ